MDYGLPETYGLSPLSQLRTGQKVWGTRYYGLPGPMGYSYLKKRRRSLAHRGVCSDHGRPRPSPAGWIPGSPPPSYLCHLPPISTFLIPRCKYLTSKNPLHLKILRGNDRWAIGRHTWAYLEEVRSPGASGMTRLVGSPKPRRGFAVIRGHPPVGERATPFFEIAVRKCGV